MIISFFVLNKTSPSLNTFPIRIFSSSISLFLTLKFLFFFDKAVPNVSILSKKLDDWITSTITPGGGYLENFFWKCFPIKCLATITEAMTIDNIIKN